MNADHNAAEYISSCRDELIRLISELCAIPAPSHGEHRRAEYCLNWLLNAGFTDAYIDSALNVIAPLNITSDDSAVVFLAHTDTVFPDETAFVPEIKNGKLHCPAAGDDTANVAVLLLCARYALNFSNSRPILFVFNSCEEGLGDLKGIKQLMSDYSGRISEVISLDGYISCAYNHPVASHRYRVEVTTQGGHSYGDFGRPNAIHILSSMIADLYTVIPPDSGKSTYNVGHISGGTSVNSIAQSASMLFEYRSDSSEGLASLKNAFDSLIACYRAAGISVETEIIGDRPGKALSDGPGQAALEQRFSKIYTDLFGRTPVFRSGSTDCNIPFSLGIPALCFGAVMGGGAHTYNEWIDLDSLNDGMRLALSMILHYFEP